MLFSLLRRHCCFPPFRHAADMLALMLIHYAWHHCVIATDIEWRDV